MTNNKPEKAIRLSGACKEFNLSMDYIIDFLANNGITIASNRNTKLTNEAYALLLQQFQEDKTAKETARELYYSKLSQETIVILNKEHEPELDDRKDMLALYNKANMLYKEGKWDDCLNIFDGLIENNYRLQKVYNRVGQVYCRKQLYQEAIVNFDKSIACDSEFSMPYNNKGVAKAKLNLPEEAIIDYTKAIELGRKYHQFYDLDTYYRNRATSYNKIGKTKNADKDIVKADKYVIEINPIDEQYITNKPDKIIDENQYPDGYGGYLDKKYIDEVLDGNPEAHWNID